MDFSWLNDGVRAQVAHKGARGCTLEREYLRVHAAVICYVYSSLCRRRLRSPRDSERNLS